MPRQSSFKYHRFPLEIILCAVRWYLRYPLSYLDVVDLLAERGILVDRSTVYRWVQKFGPELAKRTEKHLRRASVDWHVDETYIRVGGKWRYLLPGSALRQHCHERVGGLSMQAVKWSISA